jgi:hypothetical protein
MDLPLSSRIGRLAILDYMLRMALVAPQGISLRLFGALGREIGDLRTEMESELQLEGLMIERLTAAARGVLPDERKLLDEPFLFDDGEHLVEDQITSTVYERLT